MISCNETSFQSTCKAKLFCQPCGTVCLYSFGNRTSPSENSNDRWKRLCLVSWAAVPYVWTLRALARNLLTYLHATAICYCCQIVFNMLSSSFSFSRTVVTSSVWSVCSQWIVILESIQRVIHWCDIDAVDAIMSSDVALRLGALYEAAALLRTSHDPTGMTIHKWWIHVFGWNILRNMY